MSESSLLLIKKTQAEKVNFFAFLTAYIWHMKQKSHVRGINNRNDWNFCLASSIYTEFNFISPTNIDTDSNIINVQYFFYNAFIWSKSPEVYRSTGLEVSKSTNLQIYKSTNLQVNKSTSQQVNKSTGLQVYKSIGLQVYKSMRLDVYRSVTRVWGEIIQTIILGVYGLLLTGCMAQCN